jgi:hypothetical protein
VRNHGRQAQSRALYRQSRTKLIQTWGGVHGQTVPGSRVSRQQAFAVLRATADVMRRHLGVRVPTGPLAAHEGTGPMLLLNWSWANEPPRPTILMESGVCAELLGDGMFDFIHDVHALCKERGVPVELDFMTSFAISIFPTEDG